jgi:hypothetical protein
MAFFNFAKQNLEAIIRPMPAKPRHVVILIEDPSIDKFNHSLTV